MMDDFSIPAVDAIDLEIIMHRDIHFSGQFHLMVDYYKKKGIGVMPDFDLSRIKALMRMETELGKNLSDALLPMPAIDTINLAKDMYINLRECYENDNRSKEATLLSDLILTEEEYPAKEIKAIVRQGSSMTSFLTDLLKTDYFYDPLYPGYGRTPIFAAECLAKIHDEKAIPILFESLGKNNFFTDESILKALASFGEPAKQFLIKRLTSKPYSRDNELAALALASFPEDENISKASLQVLQDPLTKQWPSIAQYLVLSCEGLQDEQDRKTLLQLKDQLPSSLHADLRLLERRWSSSKKT